MNISTVINFAVVMSFVLFAGLNTQFNLDAVFSMMTNDVKRGVMKLEFNLLWFWQRACKLPVRIVRLVKPNNTVMDVGLLDGQYAYCYDPSNGGKLYGYGHTSDLSTLVRLCRSHTGSITTDDEVREALSDYTDIIERIVELDY